MTGETSGKDPVIFDLPDPDPILTTYSLEKLHIFQQNIEVFWRYQNNFVAKVI